MAQDHLHRRFVLIGERLGEILLEVSGQRQVDHQVDGVRPPSRARSATDGLGRVGDSSTRNVS